LQEAVDVLQDVLEDGEAAQHVSDDLMSELVTDRGYHSNGVLVAQKRTGIRTYIPEPNRGRRNWRGKEEEREAVYANRRRACGPRGRRLLRSRGEKLERSFAHCYDTGGMRRTHLRGHENIRKRLLIHVAGFNLGLVMRKLFGRGTPRACQGLLFALIRLYRSVLRLLEGSKRSEVDHRLISFPICSSRHRTAWGMA